MKIIIKILNIKTIMKKKKKRMIKTKKMNFKKIISLIMIIARDLEMKNSKIKIILSNKILKIFKNNIKLLHLIIIMSRLIITMCFNKKGVNGKIA